MVAVSAVEKQVVVVAMEHMEPYYRVAAWGIVAVHTTVEMPQRRLVELGVQVVAPEMDQQVMHQAAVAVVHMAPLAVLVHAVKFEFTTRR